MIILLFTLLNLGSGAEGSVKAILVHYHEGSLIESSISLNIKTQPANQTDCKGNKSIFSVLAEGGTGKIHYLWKRKMPSEQEYSAFGAVDSLKLSIYNVGVGSEAPDGTLYRVTVSDSESEINSDPARLTVNQITGIAPIGVANYTINQGQNLWLKVQTSGNSPFAFQWIRKSGNSNWPNVINGKTISGSQDAQLNFIGISLSDSGNYKVRVVFPTIDGNFCTETSSISRKITVITIRDTIPPVFINLPDISRQYCPDNLMQTEWADSLAAVPESEISFHFRKTGKFFDLNTSNFSDNTTSSENLILHWSIFSADSSLLPFTDEKGALLDDVSGQISIYPEDIIFKCLPQSNRSWDIIFWLEDASGNLTPVSQRHIITLWILQRPEIVSNF